MSWQVIIEGQVQKHTYDTEAEACQAAADARGTDWHKKIEVRDLDAPEVHTGRQDTSTAASASALPVAQPTKPDVSRK